MNFHFILCTVEHTYVQIYEQTIVLFYALATKFYEEIAITSDIWNLSFNIPKNNQSF